MTTLIVRADSLITGQVLADNRRVTRAWKAYKRGDGWGSVGIEGKHVKMFCAESVEVI